MATEIARPEDNPYVTYGDQAVGESRNILKFRRGKFLYGVDNIRLPEGTQLVANMAELSLGWIRWEDGKPDEERLSRLIDCEPVPKRKDLGDTDKDLWEVGEDGVPQDPWQFTNHLPLKDPESGEEFIFATSTRGGIGAIGALSKKYGEAYRQKPGKLPVIELNTDSYDHPIKRYGTIDVPVFTLVDWVDEDDLMEEEPQEEEPPKKATGAAKKNGRRTRF